MTKPRINPKTRKKNLLRAAMKIARTKGYNLVTQQDVAEHADVTRALISHYFGVHGGLQRAIMDEAVKSHDYKIIAQGLSIGDPVATAAPETDKANAIASMNNS